MDFNAKIVINFDNQQSQAKILLYKLRLNCKKKVEPISFNLFFKLRNRKYSKDYNYFYKNII